MKPSLAKRLYEATMDKQVIFKDAALEQEVLLYLFRHIKQSASRNEKRRRDRSADLVSYALHRAMGGK